MKRFIRAGISYIEEHLECSECGGVVDFTGTHERMALEHRDSRQDSHEPNIDEDELLMDAVDALDEGQMDLVNELIRAYVVLDSMTFDHSIAINSYRRALQIVSEGE